MRTLIDQRKIEAAGKKYCAIKSDLEKLQEQMKAAESDPERYLDLERRRKSPS
jgi:hypothetical protein